MSTKTSIKRIAAVAASALAIAGFSAVPAHAVGFTYTQAVGVITPADGSAVVGTAVTIPLTLATAAVNDTASVETFTATFAQKPTNTALTDAAGLIAGVTTRAAGLATAGAALTQVTASANTLVATAGATAVQITPATAAGEIVFTPDVPGLYEITVTPTGTAVAANTLTAITIIVGGSQILQGVSGVGTKTGSAVLGGTSTVFVQLPGASAAGQAISVTSTGGSVNNPIGCATKDATIVAAATVVRCAVGGAGTFASIDGSAGYTAGLRYTNTTLSAGNLLLAGATATSSFSFDASGSTAGTQTITVASINLATGAPTTTSTITILWTATASGAAASLSTAWINSGAVYAASDAATGITISKTAAPATASANIGVSLKDANGTALNGQKLTVVVSGPGAVSVTQYQVALVAQTAAAVAGIRATTDATANAGSTWMIGIAADGTAGVSTITISVGTTVIATKTLSFYGAAAKLTATQNYSIAKASAAGAQLGVSTSNTTATTGYVPAVSVEITDANGVDVAATLSCSIADITVINSCVIVADDNATYGAGTGFYNVSVVSAPNGVSGKSTVVTIRTQLSSGAYVTAPVTFTLGGSVVSTAVTLDKTSYQPGEAMVLSVTTKDSAGNPSYDGQAILGSISSNKTVGGALPAVTKVFALGKYATSATAPTLYAPALSGDFTINGVSVATAAATSGIAYSVTASVEADASNGLALDAANAATDAANNAYDEAQNATQAASDALAAVTALSAQVSALIATVKSLAAMVAKIKAKVKA